MTQQPNVKLLTTSARAAERHVSKHSEQCLANMSWLFATMKQPDEKLFASFAQAAER